MRPYNIFLNYHLKCTMDFLVKQDSFVGWVGLSLSVSRVVECHKKSFKNLTVFHVYYLTNLSDRFTNFDTMNLRFFDTKMNVSIKFG